MQATVVKPETIRLENGLVFSAKYREFETYIPLAPAVAKAKGTKYSSLEVRVYYTLGGMNYFSGGTTPRCYALAVKPVDKYEGGTSRTLMGSGFDAGSAVAVVETRAYSAKKLAALAALVNPQEWAALYVAGDMSAMQAKLEEIRSQASRI